MSEHPAPDLPAALRQSVHREQPVRQRRKRLRGPLSGVEPPEAHRQIHRLERLDVVPPQIRDEDRIARLQLRGLGHLERLRKARRTLKVGRADPHQAPRLTARAELERPDVHAGQLIRRKDRTALPSGDHAVDAVRVVVAHCRSRCRATCGALPACPGCRGCIPAPSAAASPRAPWHPYRSPAALAALDPPGASRGSPGAVGARTGSSGRSCRRGRSTRRGSLAVPPGCAVDIAKPSIVRRPQPVSADLFGTRYPPRISRMMRARMCP